MPLHATNINIIVVQTSMYLGVYGGLGMVEAIVEVSRELLLLLSCTVAGRGKLFATTILFKLCQEY